ncbi:hypothetical protein XIS1_1180020 [Xenorhabdus innexi]|uniref:Uncharacterized protein n=1 Tax=Xenorhabdus innexi TaxID=290109 RepID=A0A1N6MRL6_9GAMM|nr:hypothetical protein XIS1_1180020 [Xenorhabdus innexi]
MTLFRYSISYFKLQIINLQLENTILYPTKNINHKYADKYLLKLT